MRRLLAAATAAVSLVAVAIAFTPGNSAAGVDDDGLFTMPVDGVVQVSVDRNGRPEYAPP